MVKIAIDAGHAGFGVTPGKRTPAGEFEWTFNNKVVLAAIAELNNYEGVQLLRLDDPTGRRDVPLRERTNKANQWGADLVWSKHFNAITGRWGNHTGTETFTFNGNKSHNAESVRVARVLHQAMLKAWGLRDRGLKTANFHMVREPNCPAVLTEGGFMDSNIDIKIMRDDAKLAEGGREMARALANYYGLKLKAGTSSSSDAYTVKAGDTLWGIANSHGVSVADLKQWNNLTGDLIRPGQELSVKGKAKPVASQPVTQPSSTPQPAPRPQPQVTQLVIDGSFGPATTRRLQQVLGTQVTGAIGGQQRTAITENIPAARFGSGGSMVVREMQRRLNLPSNQRGGLFGPLTLEALQRRMGTPVTGAISRTNSAVVKELQRRLNQNRF